MNGITDLFHSENEYYDNQRVTGFVQGTVVENNNADFKGMVKGEFTVWESGKNLCEWVRLLSHYGGADYGLYCVPEINETVLVGFIGGSLKRPFLLGSLYPGGASMVSENFDDKNLKKHLKTKGGMDLLILEENGKQSVTLTTPKGNVLTVSDETESCKISDKDGKNQISMDYKNGKVTGIRKGCIYITAKYKGRPYRCEVYVVKNNERYVGMCKVTYYCGCDICSEGLVNSQGKPIGSTGEVLKANYSIAVDPSVIPLGSDVLIGDKVYKAVDTGGAIKGKRIDVYLGDSPSAHKLSLRMGLRNYPVRVLN